MRVADYLAERVASFPVRHVFAVVGGGAMHLDDAFGLREDIELVFGRHEQGCAMAAEGYVRSGAPLGCVLVTTGPGGTNTLTGVLGQWHDSVPVLYISGQVRFDTTVASTGLPLRQLGDQEADIVRLVSPIAKYAAFIQEAESVRYHFEKAVWLATHGRPGPVWLDVPMNVQAARIDPEKLEGFGANASRDGEADWPRYPPAPAPSRGSPLSAWPPVEEASQAPGAKWGTFNEPLARRQAEETLDLLRRSERPVILAGSAIRASGALPAFAALVDSLGVPVCTAWNAHDVLPTDHHLFAGRPGTLGDRAGNFALQNADVVVSLGCRLNVRQIGYEFAAFARHAVRVAVDIDEAELAKPTSRPVVAVHGDVRFFINEMRKPLRASAWSSGSPKDLHAAWVEWCRERRRRYPTVLPEFRRRDEPIDPYVFVDELAARLEPGDIVVCANGAACVVTFQVMNIKEGQRLIANSGTAGMGYDLPAAIGAAYAVRAGYANPPREGRIVCLAGDGSIQMNIQELETIISHHLPIKIFVFNNNGYLSIRQTQDNLCQGRRVGEGPQSGLTFPDLVRVADAYGISGARVSAHSVMAKAIDGVLRAEGPALLDVVMDPEAAFVPKVTAERLPDGRLVSKPLEDMFPFLDRDEFADNMLVEQYRHADEEE